MKQRAKRITVVLLAVAFAVLLGVGLLLAFLPNRARFADHTAELSEEDLEFNYISTFAYTADTPMGWDTITHQIKNDFLA